MKDQFQSKISNYNAFLGRRALVSKIYARIGAGRPQSVSIVGDIKIGKSSLLWFLAHDKTKEKMLFNPADYIFVFVPCRDIKPLTLEGFTDSLYDLTHQHAEVGDTTESKGFKYNYFKQLVESQHKKNKKIILFLDDFNLITQNPAFPLEFFSFLRSLANNYNLAYVTSSYEDLQKLCISKDIEESPFFNIFTNMSLRGFEAEEVKDFLKQSFTNNDQVALSESDYLVHLVGNAPYPLQMATQFLLEYKDQSEGWNNKTRADLESKLKQNLRSYFQSIWDGMEEIHQSILSNLAQNNKISGYQDYIVRDLNKKDYIRMNNGKSEIASRLFKIFVLTTSGADIKEDETKSLFFKLMAKIKKIIKF